MIKQAVYQRTIPKTNNQSNAVSGINYGFHSRFEQQQNDTKRVCSLREDGIETTEIHDRYAQTVESIRNALAILFFLGVNFGAFMLNAAIAESKSVDEFLTILGLKNK